MNHDPDFTPLSGPELLALHERVTRARVSNSHAITRMCGQHADGSVELGGELIDLFLCTRAALLARMAAA